MNDVYCVFGASVPGLHMLAVSKQQTCMMCSYSASNHLYYFIQFIHVFFCSNKN